MKNIYLNLTKIAIFTTLGSLGISGSLVEGSSAIGSNDNWRGFGGIRFFSTRRLENPPLETGSSESSKTNVRKKKIEKMLQKKR